MRLTKRPPASQSARFVGALALLGLSLLACSRHDHHREPANVAADVATARGSEQRAVAGTPSPSLLLDTGGSAYAATLAIDGEASYLLTGSAAFRLVPKRAPQRWGLELGVSPALRGEQFLYWTAGAFRAMPKRGGKPAVVASVPHQPTRIVAFGDRFAWLERAADGHTAIHTLDGTNVRILHVPTGHVAALAMDDDLVYFAERGPKDGWRLGAVSLAGGTPRYTGVKQGRTPAMLAVARDLFYYDGPSSTVRRVSSDLEREDVIARDVICSPMAVAAHIYCAQPAGLLEIGFDGVTRQALPLERRGSITAIAATATRLTWLTDVGEDRLAVQTVTLQR